MMRTLDLRGLGSGRARGHRHGETFAGEIASLAELRLYLAGKISGLREKTILRLADEHLPVLQRFDQELYDELIALAESAGISAARAVVLNHYTDLRDLREDDRAEPEDFDGGCTMVWAPTAEGIVFGQTWDMHATAAPYVTLLRVDDVAGAEAWLLSLTGCLGMAGMNGAGLGVGINNLTSEDARVGVVWSAIIRKVLRCAAAPQARDLILDAEVGSGHHYLVTDADSGFGIETSGSLRKLVFEGGVDSAAYAHANHCLDGEIAACSRVPKHSTTWERQKWMDAALAERALQGLDDLWQRLGSVDGYPRSICTNMATPSNPHAAATCAGIAMKPATQSLWAVAGFTNASVPTQIKVGAG
jgi:isopenicillin-N N-acyltransferase-like protein